MSEQKRDRKSAGSPDPAMKRALYRIAIRENGYQFRTGPWRQIKGYNSRVLRVGTLAEIHEAHMQEARESSGFYGQNEMSLARCAGHGLASKVGLAEFDPPTGCVNE